MNKVRIIVHDYKAGKDVWFGPFQNLEIHEKSVWAMDESGRKAELGYIGPDGFWHLFHGNDKRYKTATGKTFKVSVDAEIKAAS